MPAFIKHQSHKITSITGSGMKKNNPDWIIEKEQNINKKNNEVENLTELETISESSTKHAAPQELPILPLRGLVAYPQTALPLTIGQSRSIRLVDQAASEDTLIGLVAAKDPDLETPGPDDLYSVGTTAKIQRLFRAPDGTIRILVQALDRFRIDKFTEVKPFLKAKITEIPEVIESGIEIEALARNAREQFSHIAEMIPSIPSEIVSSISTIEDPLQSAYLIANFQRMEPRESQSILEMDSTIEKLTKLSQFLTREIEVLEIGQRIQNEARSEIDRVQREYFLREQLKAIQRELGESDDKTAEVEEFRKNIEEAGLPTEAEKQAKYELERMSRLPLASPEFGIIRTYLHWLTALPWSKTTQDNLDIAHARKILDKDHYGLEDVKDRILEFLAVRKLRLDRKEEFENYPSEDELRREREGVILCFIGPPGVGKTSLGQSIARAMERKFIRISLGGVRDEAEIRGHRRTYIGAMPGRIIHALRRVESRNPVFMLDEIDKLGADFRGDPSAALLEALDPEQNNEFRDNYLEVGFDLSQVMFITTANQLETIPSPLLDRMEIIKIAGYTEKEKINIARYYLIPRQIRENGLRMQEIDFSDEGIKHIIRMYTREAGVRNLERELGTICRKIATKITEGVSVQSNLISPEVVTELLGRAKFIKNAEIAARTSLPGVATGLAWTPVGGEILFIEASRMAGSKGFQITGSIGKVMQESAQAALSYVRSHANALNLDPDFYESTDLHLHIPSGAQPKDGPSAGVTIISALVSLLTNKTIRPNIGMTGEISLSGQVLPVGGIKEKVLAAHQAGLDTIILPSENKVDLDEISEEVRNAIKFVFVDTVDSVLETALGIPEISKGKEEHVAENTAG